MRTYDGNNFFMILFKRVVPYHLVEVLRNTCIATCFSVIMATLNQETGLNIRITSPWINTLTVFNFFLGMFISFRLNSSFTSWSTGVQKISELENTSSKLLSSIYAETLSNQCIDNGERLRLVLEFKNDLILYIASVFKLCSGDNGRMDDQREYYLNSSQLNTKKQLDTYVKRSRAINTDIVESCMESRFYNRIIELNLRQSIGNISNYCNLHPSVVGGFGGKIDTLSNITNTLYGMSNVPVVFIYNQFINFVIVNYLVLYTLTTIPDAGYWSSFWVFIWSFIVFLANSIAGEIDSPFGTDNNDIELEIILSNIKDEYNGLYDFVRSQNLQLQ